MESVTKLQNVDREDLSDEDTEDSGTEDVHTAKTLTKGRNLFTSGHVKNMNDNQQK